MVRPDLNTMTTVDYILIKHCGGMGIWQLQNSIFVMLVWFASCYPLFITIFTTYAPDHRWLSEQAINRDKLTSILTFTKIYAESISHIEVKVNCHFCLGVHLHSPPITQ